VEPDVYEENDVMEETQFQLPPDAGQFVQDETVFADDVNISDDDSSGDVSASEDEEPTGGFNTSAFNPTDYGDEGGTGLGNFDDPDIDGLREPESYLVIDGGY
jgi:hypothetical protein